MGEYKNMSKIITFLADKVIIYGPKVDGGYSIRLEVGEYQKKQIADLVELSDLNVEVTIKEETKTDKD